MGVTSYLFLRSKCSQSLNRQITEEHLLPDDDSDFHYSDIPLDEELLAEDDQDEELEKVVRTINEAAQDALAQVNF